MTKNCKTCSELKIINNSKKCLVCEAKSIALYRYAVANIPIEFWNKEMANFKGSEALRKFYKEYSEQLTIAYNEGYSFLLAGSYGLGKSMVATNILKLACQKGFSCLYTTLSDVVGIVVEAPYEDKFIAKKEILNCDFLVLDEIDPRFMSTGSIELFGKTLENMIRTRIYNKLPNIFITNSPNVLESFSGEIGESLKSLFNTVKQCTFIGSDYRKNIKV